MYPSGVITKTGELINISSSTIETLPSTIYGVSIQQSGSQSETSILCGSSVVSHNYGTRDLTQELIVYPCNNSIIINKTGQGDKAFYQISYATTTPSSTIPAVYGGFTYGEIIISLFLFFIFSIAIYLTLKDL